jgi:hypothetical protein
VPPAVAEAREQHLSHLEDLEQLKTFDINHLTAEDEELIAHAKAREKAKANE